MNDTPFPRQNNRLPDTTEAVRSELTRLNELLRLPQRQITWRIHHPLSEEEVERRIRLFKLGSWIGTAVQAAIMAYVYFSGILGEDFLRSIFGAFFLLFLAWNVYTAHVLLPKKARTRRVAETEISLDLDKGRLRFNEEGRRRSLKLDQAEKLPAFVLPPNADAGLHRLRDEVQKQLTQLSGLRFQ